GIFCDPPGQEQNSASKRQVQRQPSLRGVTVSPPGAPGALDCSSHRRVYTSAGLPGTGSRFVKYYRHHHAWEQPAHAAAFVMGFLLPFVILIARWHGGLLKNDVGNPCYALNGRL